MAYGDNRNVVATDTFDSSIDGSWDNGWADNNPFAWASGGEIEGTVDNSTHGMRRNTGTYADDQYSSGTISVWANVTNVTGVATRCASGAADESCYLAAGSVYGPTYEIYEGDSAAGLTLLAFSGTLDTTVPVIITCEAEGTTIRCGSSENGGADTQRVTTTDATLASGRPGLIMYFDGLPFSNVRITSWEGGYIGAAAPNTSQVNFRIYNDDGGLLP